MLGTMTTTTTTTLYNWTCDRCGKSEKVVDSDDKPDEWTVLADPDHDNMSDEQHLCPDCGYDYANFIMRKPTRAQNLMYEALKLQKELLDSHHFRMSEHHILLKHMRKKCDHCDCDKGIAIRDKVSKALKAHVND